MRGLSSYPALARPRSSKASLLTIRVPPWRRSARSVLRAAGFIATRQSGRSPEVEMSQSAIWIWKEETPGRVPAGARISAGKLGRVNRSLPKAAEVSAKRLPANCIPSPESPANRTVTCLNGVMLPLGDGSETPVSAWAVGDVTLDIQNLDVRQPIIVGPRLFRTFNSNLTGNHNNTGTAIATLPGLTGWPSPGREDRAGEALPLQDR